MLWATYWKHLYMTKNSRKKDKIYISMVSYQKGPTRHAYAWQIGPFWQDILNILLKLWQDVYATVQGCSKWTPFYASHTFRYHTVVALKEPCSQIYAAVNGGLASKYGSELQLILHVMDLHSAGLDMLFPMFLWLLKNSDVFFIRFHFQDGKPHLPIFCSTWLVNTLRPTQNGHHFTVGILRLISCEEILYFVLVFTLICSHLSIKQ